MKHIIHKLYRPVALALCLCAALTFASCDDFLDMQPTNSGNAEEAVRTVRDAQVVLNGVMSAMTSYAYYGRNMFMYADAKGGDLTIYMAGRGLDDLYTFNHTPTTGTYSGFWSQIYYCILQVNTLLDNIDRLEAEGSEEDFTFARGQALTLRALFYFDLVRLYGLPYTYDKASPGVPNITRPLDVSAQPTRATVEENYRQIVADLEEAEPLLATDKSPQDGYVGYYANLALQARVKLYMADYDGALAAARTVIDDGAYTPYEPGEWVDSWSHQYGSESILELAILNDESDLGTSSLGFYLMRDGQLDGAMGWFLASDYFLDRLGQDPADVRWGVMDNDEYWVRTGQERHGSCYKYMGGTSLPGDGKDKNTAVNIKLIRLSEVYLIAAEAALHASAPDAAAAATYLNQVRRRSPGLPAATAATVSDDMIMDERSKELFAEGHRYYDIRRWAIAEDHLQPENFRGLNGLTVNPSFEEFNQIVPTSQPIQWNQRQYLLPITNSELYSDPQLVQAPGY